MDKGDNMADTLAVAKIEEDYKSHKEMSQIF